MKKNTRLYNIYYGMKKRCYNKNTANYKNYGARGITICSEWLNDKQSFFAWAINNGYQDNLTIDRIDVNGNYEPNNCRWVDMKQQQRNRTDNHYATINGETHCLKEWCEILNLNYGKVCKRVHYNWPIEQALELEERPRDEWEPFNIEEARRHD